MFDTLILFFLTPFCFSRVWPSPFWQVSGRICSSHFKMLKTDVCHWDEKVECSLTQGVCITTDGGHDNDYDEEKWWERKIDRKKHKGESRQSNSVSQADWRQVPGSTCLFSLFLYHFTSLPFSSPPPISPLSSFAGLITHSILTTSGVVWTGTSSGGPFVKVPPNPTVTVCWRSSHLARERVENTLVDPWLHDEVVGVIFQMLASEKPWVACDQSWGRRSQRREKRWNAQWIKMIVNEERGMEGIISFSQFTVAASFFPTFWAGWSETSEQERKKTEQFFWHRSFVDFPNPLFFSIPYSLLIRRYPCCSDRKFVRSFPA